MWQGAWFVGKPKASRIPCGNAGDMIRKRYWYKSGIDKSFAINRATVRLQAWSRCLKAKTKYTSAKMKSVVIIQSFSRGLSAQKLYRISKLASIRIQSMWWRCKSVLHTRRLRTTSIIVFHARYRGFITRRKMQALRLSTINIQSIMWTFMSVESYRSCKGAILSIQTWYRGICAKESYNKVRSSTIIIQRHYHQLRKKGKTRWWRSICLTILITLTIPLHFPRK